MKLIAPNVPLNMTPYKVKTWKVAGCWYKIRVCALTKQDCDSNQSFITYGSLNYQARNANQKGHA